MVGVLSSRRLILGVLFSQKSTLGVLFPQEPMNMFGQLGKNLLQSRPRRRKSSRTRAAQLNPSASPVPDLRRQLNKKRSADQVTLHCRCKRIIASVLADCTCSAPIQTKSVFERISATSFAELTKHLRFDDED